MNENMPILWRNCLDQFSTEIGRKAWVWFAETRGRGMQYQADRYAHEVERLYLSMRPMIAHAGRAFDADGEVLDDLARFILKRHANWRIGGNVAPGFLDHPGTGAIA